MRNVLSKLSYFFFLRKKNTNARTTHDAIQTEVRSGMAAAVADEDEGGDGEEAADDGVWGNWAGVGDVEVVGDDDALR